MGKTAVGHPGLAFDRSFDLSEFYARLHHVIGGTGPDGLAWDLELPDTSLPPEQFRIEYLWCEIASKYNPRGGKTQRARKEKGLSLFRESEEECSNINVALNQGRYRRSPVCKDRYVTLDSVLFTASKKISALLGRFRWEECDGHMDFGPGASYALSRAKAHPWTKFETDLDVNPSSVPLALAVLAARPAWCRSLIKQGGCIVPNPKNRVTTVPKNYKRDRVIAVEPLMGIFLQKGIGGVIRKRLKKVGINLNDQRANQLGALIGSLSGELATVDLKAASDTISIGVVEQLLPPDWLHALEQCRSQLGVLDSGEKILYRKFSSMGCGFTFELETLIFWGVCSAVLDLMESEDRRLLVYGDDIVCPTTMVEPVLRALQLCGFTPNEKKTHVTGPFRESCGKHYLGGFDVTPFYIKEEIREPGDLFLLHNNLMRWASRGFIVDSPYRDSFEGRLPALLEWIRSHLPMCERPTICDTLGDSGFIGSFDEVRPTTRKLVPESRRGSKGPGHSCLHYALDHWPDMATTKPVFLAKHGGLMPLVLHEFDRRSRGLISVDELREACNKSSVREAELLIEAYRVASSSGDSPPHERVVARKRKRKILRLPVVGWYEIGPWV